MKSLKEIRAFADEMCSLYHIYPRAELLYSSLADVNGLDKATSEIRILSVILGMNEEDVAETNRRAAKKLYRKYPFFDMIDLFICRKKSQSVFETKEGRAPNENDYLLNAIFGTVFKYKYSREELIERLKQGLIEYDKYIPGTYHKNAEITEFVYEVDTFFDFPDYQKMMESFFKMYDRLSSLFFKALKVDLTKEEINEYNLLVSCFGATSKFYVDSFYVGGLYYDILCKNRKVYNSTGYHDFSSFIRIKNRWDTDNPVIGFEPWKCRQFVEHEEYAQRFQDLFPQAKDFIRGTCMHIKNIWCSFVWSDAPYKKEYDYDGSWYYSDEQEETEVFIPKTIREIGDDAKHAELLSKMASPESKGGLKKRNSKSKKDNISSEQSVDSTEE